jgi:glycine/D-amino acid oxidase-like deaminating enzyme
LKSSADVVIIGGGVEGCSIAYNLALEGGGSVVLLEKNTLASGSTGKSCGIIRTHYSQEILMKMAHMGMAELITKGAASSVDISPMRPSRYDEGEYFQSKYARSPLT